MDDQGFDRRNFLKGAVVGGAAAAAGTVAVTPIADAQAQQPAAPAAVPASPAYSFLNIEEAAFVEAAGWPDHGVKDLIGDEKARNNLLRYGEDRWDGNRIDREIGTAAAWAAKYQVPLTCNEFGVFRNFAPPADRAAWIRDMRTALEKYGIGWTMWDYAGGFGVVNKQNGHATPDDQVVKALGLGIKK